MTDCSKDCLEKALASFAEAKGIEVTAINPDALDAITHVVALCQAACADKAECTAEATEEATEEAAAPTTEEAATEAEAPAAE